MSKDIEKLLREAESKFNKLFFVGFMSIAVQVIALVWWKLY